MEAPAYYWNELSLSPYLSLYTWRQVGAVLESFEFGGPGDLFSVSPKAPYAVRRLTQSETQIATETLRYATRPGQALAYRLGYEKIWELRRRAERDLGEAFDVREFHAALLESGSLPLEVLEEHIDWWIEGRSRPRSSVASER